MVKSAKLRIRIGSFVTEASLGSVRPVERVSFDIKKATNVIQFTYRDSLFI